MKFQEETSDNPKYIANMFAQNFALNYATRQTSNLEDHALLYANSLINMNHIVLTEMKIFNQLKKLPKNACMGPDEISPLLFRACAKSLTPPLALIFQKSLDTGVFPTQWKTSYITPIFKSKNKALVENYRPVCISSIIPKLFENLISQVIYPILYNVVEDHQHGFMKYRSTATNLISFTEYITENIKDGDQVDCIFTDFSKCFDQLNHEILITKLKSVGIGGSLLDWLASFHKNRKQIVKIRAYSKSDHTNNNPSLEIFKSNPIHVPSGCIQGGHLSGILFLCYINDIVRILPPNVRGWLYAHDFKLAMRVRSGEDVNQLQEVVRRLNRWCDANLMKLNLEKCKIMTFHTNRKPILANYNIDNVSLSRVYEIKDLGVTFESNLKFNNHFSNIKNKSQRMLGLLYRHTRDFRNPNTLINLYNSYVRSNLEYCCTVWSPQYATHINRLESIQHKFLKMLAYKTFNVIVDHNYEEIMSKYNIITYLKRS